ncbi:hypothetical protein AYO45_00835 [Gammaproteobacteria bacterium SCGC AG-212-F23]|nr:hypothetical protein AYO45_00835 [Gammaproteobacteria bacterium SCGC AG-212-F23]
MKSILIVLSMAIIPLFASPVFSEEKDWLYETKIPVTSQLPEARTAVLPQALAQVLVKTSGDSKILSNSEIKLALKNANKWLQAFSYTSADENHRYQLVAHFSPKAVNHLLQEANIAFWGENRPVVLAWVEYETPGQVAEIIHTDTPNSMASLLKDNADRRGLPLILPMMDFTDMNQVGVNDIVTKSIPVLSQAAKRYASDAMLIVRIFKQQKDYSATATLILEKDQWDLTAAGKTPAKVIAALIDAVADDLAGRYAHNESTTPTE